MKRLIENVKTLCENKERNATTQIYKESDNEI